MGPSVPQVDLTPVKGEGEHRTLGKRGFQLPELWESLSQATGELRAKAKFLTRGNFEYVHCSGTARLCPLSHWL